MEKHGIEELVANLAELRTLLSSEKARDVESLKLRRGIGYQVVKLLVGSHHMTDLLRLDLSHQDVNNSDAAALARCDNFKNLVHLDLSRNRLTIEGVKCLLSSKSLTNLQSLSLGENEIGFEDIVFLVNHKRYNNGPSVYFNDCLHDVNFSSDEVRCLIRQPVYDWLLNRWPLERDRLDAEAAKDLVFYVASVDSEGYSLEFVLDYLMESGQRFLINSKNEQARTLSSFYTSSTHTLRYLFVRGMIPPTCPSLATNALQRLLLSASVLDEELALRTDIIGGKLCGKMPNTLEGIESLKLEMKRLLELYMRNPIRLKLLAISDNQKLSLRRTCAGDTLMSDREFVELIITGAQGALQGEYFRSFESRCPLAEQKCDDLDARPTVGHSIQEVIAQLKLFLDKCNVPLEDKKELLVTYVEQNLSSVMAKWPTIEIGSEKYDIFFNFFDRFSFQSFLRDKSDEAIDKLSDKIASFNMEQVWREQMEISLIEQIYIAAAAEEDCLTHLRLVNVPFIDRLAAAVECSYRGDVKQFVASLAEDLIVHTVSHPHLKEPLRDLTQSGLAAFDHPERLTFEQQEVLSFIHEGFCHNCDVEPESEFAPNSAEYAYEVRPAYIEPVPCAHLYRIFFEELMSAIRLYCWKLGRPNQINVPP